jgi:Calx-beta domain
MASKASIHRIGGTIVSLHGKAVVRLPDGQTVPLNLHDAVTAGMVVTVEPGGRATLKIADGSRVDLSGGRDILVTREILEGHAPHHHETTVHKGSYLDPAHPIVVADISKTLPAPGYTPGDAGSHGFVRLLRIVEGITPEAVHETVAIPLVTQPQDPGGGAGIPPTTPENHSATHPTISINDVTVNEAAGKEVFTVTLSGPSSTPVTVSYGTHDGTALAGTDYGATTGTVTFAPGQTVQTITVPVINDDGPNDVFAGLLNYTVVLTNPSNATIAKGTGVGGIDDSGAPVPPDPNNPPPTIPEDDRCTGSDCLDTVLYLRRPPLGGGPHGLPGVT